MQTDWVGGIREGQLMTSQDENGDLAKIGARLTLKWHHHEADSAGASTEFDYFRTMVRS